MNWLMVGWIGGKMDGWIDRLMDGDMNGWMDWFMDGWIGEWMYGCLEGFKDDLSKESFVFFAYFFHFFMCKGSFGEFFKKFDTTF